MCTPDLHLLGNPSHLNIVTFQHGRDSHRRKGSFHNVVKGLPEPSVVHAVGTEGGEERGGEQWRRITTKPRISEPLTQATLMVLK